MYFIVRFEFLKILNLYLLFSTSTYQQYMKIPPKTTTMTPTKINHVKQHLQQLFAAAVKYSQQAHPYAANVKKQPPRLKQKSLR